MTDPSAIVTAALLREFFDESGTDVRDVVSGGLYVSLPIDEDAPVY